MKITKIGELPKFNHRADVKSEYPFRSWTGSQCPTPVFDGDNLKISFSSRDINGASYCFSYLVNPDKPWEVITKSSAPDYSPSPNPGTYYYTGFMISQYYTDAQARDYVYFTGWEDYGDNVVKYRTSCGQAFDGKPGVIPLIDRTKLGVCGTSMPFRDGSSIYHMAVDKWSLGEPYYFIASWEYAGGKPINKSVIERWDGEGGLARPVVFYNDKKKYLMFSARGKTKYRTEKSEAYKLYLAEYEKDYANEWSRHLHQIKIHGAETDLMQAYGYPIKIKDTWYLFYNNTFTSNIQVATIEF